MNLDAVNKSDLNRWLMQPASKLFSHEAKCCQGAKAWLIAMGRAFDFSSTEKQWSKGPDWLSQKYKWGSNSWPLYWCEAIHLKTVDCGVFSVFAQEIFHTKGIPCFPGQVIQFVGEHNTSHLKANWIKKPGGFDWIGQGFIYHEICMIQKNSGEVKIYDPTEGQWLIPDWKQSHGAPIAVRSEAPIALKWGAYTLRSDQWIQLESNEK